MPHDRYETTDLGLAAALIVKGFKLDKIDSDTPYRSVFIFEGQDGIKSAAEAYYDDTLMVPAQKMALSIKSVKARIPRRGPRG